jgi:hypothetical protein
MGLTFFRFPRGFNNCNDKDLCGLNASKNSAEATEEKEEDE